MLHRRCKAPATETANTFGMRHCFWHRGLMDGSNRLTESDARLLHLRPVDLRKLQRNIGSTSWSATTACCVSMALSRAFRISGSIAERSTKAGEAEFP